MRVPGWAGVALPVIVCLGSVTAPAAAEPVLPSGFQDTVGF